MGSDLLISFEVVFLELKNLQAKRAQLNTEREEDCFSESNKKRKKKRQGEV